MKLTLCLFLTVALSNFSWSSEAQEPYQAADADPSQYASSRAVGFTQHPQDRDLEDNEQTGSILYMVSPITGLGQLVINPVPYLLNLSSSSLSPSNGANNSTQDRSLVSGQSPLSGTNRAKKPIIAAYYPDWNVGVLAPEQIQYSNYDLIYFAFAIPNENCALEFTQQTSLLTLDKLVDFAHKNGTKVVLSIGGWTGSKYFSVVVKTQEMRQLFVKNIVEIVSKHHLDGVDIDWEYPGEAQVQSNLFSETDSEAMLSFLQLLRQAVGDDKIISAAVTDYTFVNKDGNRMTNVTGFAQVLDYIFIMNYDVWGSSSAPGPNAPFSNACQDSNQPGANMVNAISTWTASGFPSEKIIMGLAAYGYINHASTTSLIHRKRAASDGLGSLKYDHYRFQSQRLSKKRQEPCSSSVGNCFENQLNNIISVTNRTTQGTYNVTLNTTLSLPPNNANVSSTSVIQRATQSGAGNGHLDSYAGSQISFDDLFKWGVLSRNISDPRGGYIGANGYIIAWDSCSSTPYAYCTNMNTVVTYDDWNSTGIKAAYALKEGIAGVGFWEMTGDLNSELVNSARKNLGL